MTRQLPIVDDGSDSTLQAFMHDGDERLAVWQNARYRWLERQGVLQSAMDLAHPERPMLPHQSALLRAAQYAGHAISDVTEMGLGGGANARYLASRHGLNQYTIIERSPAVIALCRTHFPLPGCCEVVSCDAADWAPTMTPQSQDLVIVDIGMALGLPPLYRNPDFWCALASSLRPRGRLVINALPASGEEITQLTQQIQEAGTGPLAIEAVPGYANVILAATCR